MEDLSRFLDESYHSYEQKYGGTWRLFRRKWQDFTAEDLVGSFGEA